MWPHCFDNAGDAFRCSEVCTGQTMSSTMRTWASGITCSPPTMSWASSAALAPTLSSAPVPLLKQVCCACCSPLACYDMCCLWVCLTAQTSVAFSSLLCGLAVCRLCECCKALLSVLCSTHRQQWCSQRAKSVYLLAALSCRVCSVTTGQNW